MEVLQTIIKYLWGPLVGAVIGYLTNLIAVKMLFHPHKAVMIGKWQLPFTPGIVPRRREALSAAIGRAVGERLLTGDDLRKLFLSDETKEKVIDMAVDALDLDPISILPDAKTVDLIATEYLSVEQWLRAKEKITEFLTEQIGTASADVNIGGIIAERGAEVFLEKKASLGVMGVFLNENTVKAFLPALGEKINEYMREHGAELVRDAVASKVNEYTARPFHDLLEYIEREQIRTVIGAVYEKLIEGVGSHFTEMLDIASSVKEKVDAMSIDELEELCNSVMKKELQAVINLGALIGLALGIFNLFV